MKFLKKVLKINNVEGNVESLPVGLAGGNGYTGIVSQGTGSSLTGTSGNIETRTLDSILNERGLLDSNPLVKMDIEGSEIEAIKGAKEVIQRGAKFVIAAYHEVNGQQTVGPLSDFFSNQGYNVDITYPEHLLLVAKR